MSLMNMKSDTAGYDAYKSGEHPLTTEESIGTDIGLSSSSSPRLAYQPKVNIEKSLNTSHISQRPMGPPGPPGGWLSHKMTRGQEMVFNIMVCMVQLIPQACLTTCFPIIQIITRDFAILDPATLPWVVAAYALSFGTTILVAGRLGDIFGHKLMVILGFSCLAFFSVLAGLSQYTTYEVFFVARALQGVGSALMNPNALALLGRSYPPGSKGKIIAFSAFGLCAPLGAYTGMLGSAIIGQFWHWSWCFYITAIVAALLAVVAYFVLPSPPKTPKQMLPLSKKLGQMDWLGSITGVGGMISIQVALICAPSEGWNTQYIFMLLIIGLLLITFFIIVELRVSTEPLVPFKLLSGNVAFVLGAVACGWGTFGVWTFYLWRFLLTVWHDAPIMAALHVLPIVPVALVAAALTAVLMRTTKPAWILFWSLVAFTLGPMFLALNQRSSIYWTFTFLSLLVTPFGMDMSFPAATFIMSNSLPMDKQGVAGSLVTTVVNYSISLGLGFASTVEVHVNDGGKNQLDGIRGGFFMGIGTGCLGIVICTAYVIRSVLSVRKDQSTEKESDTIPLSPSSKPHAKSNPQTPMHSNNPSQSQSELFTGEKYRRGSEASSSATVIGGSANQTHSHSPSSEKPSRHNTLVRDEVTDLERHHALSNLLNQQKGCFTVDSKKQHGPTVPYKHGQKHSGNDSAKLGTNESMSLHNAVTVNPQTNLGNPEWLAMTSTPAPSDRFHYDHVVDISRQKPLPTSNFDLKLHPEVQVNLREMERVHRSQGSWESQDLYFNEHPNRDLEALHSFPAVPRAI